MLDKMDKVILYGDKLKVKKDKLCDIQRIRFDLKKS